MQSKTFTSGRIRRADYDETTQQLDLHRDDKTVLAYKQVPMEVFRRLCSAPNPTTYWEDRIAEEYPKWVAMGKVAGGGLNDGESEAARKFGDLFGGGD
jgi:hypothetical protein